MTSIFSRIIAGELPARMVHEDAATVAFLTIAPLKPGHTLVVPRKEVDSWLDLSADELVALWAACAKVGRAIDEVFRPRKVAALLLGLEVPHVHVHLVPVNSESEVRFDLIDRDPDPAALDDVQRRLAAALDGG